MALSDRKVPILTGINDIPSTSGANHPNASLLCARYNALIDDLTALLPASPPASPPTDTTTVELYVDSATGSDSNAGTLAAPLQTIQKALDLVKARKLILPDTGDHTIYLAGTFTLTVSLDMTGLTIGDDASIMFKFTATDFNTLPTIEIDNAMGYQQFIRFDNPDINHLQFYFQYVNFTCNNPVVFYGGGAWLFDACVFTIPQYYSNSAIAAYHTKLQISSSEIAGSTSAAWYGIELYDCNCLMSSCTVALNNGDMLYAEHSVVVASESTITFTRNTGTLKYYLYRTKLFLDEDIDVGSHAQLTWSEILQPNGFYTDYFGIKPNQPAITDATIGTEVDTINAILGALRNAGIIQ